MSNRELLIRQVEEADMVLIGLGEEFRTEVPEALFEGYAADDWRREMIKAGYLRQLPDDCESLQAYRELKKIVGRKPYFIVTMNPDDLIYRSGFHPFLIVSPCGSMGRLQCDQHTWEAGETVDELYRGALEHRELERPLCPVCNQEGRLNILENRPYLEKGYLEQWQAYTRWLSATLNKKLCVLELGVGFAHPEVIRWAFEKIVYFNQKAALVRVHSMLPQITKELSGKGISIAEHPIRLLLDGKEGTEE